MAHTYDCAGTHGTIACDQDSSVELVDHHHTNIAPLRADGNYIAPGLDGATCDFPIMPPGLSRRPSQDTDAIDEHEQLCPTRDDSCT